MKSIIAAAAALMLTGGVFAQDTFEIEPAQAATADVLVNQALDSDLAWSVVESLTTEVGPRLAGSEAEARARAWGEALGNSLNFDRVAVENFTMPFWDRGELEISMTAPYNLALHGAALGGSGRSPRLGAINSDVVYFRNVAALMAVADGSLEGKIAFVDGDPLVATQTGAGYGPANQRRRIGWQHAERAGADAIVVRSVGSDHHRNPHTGMISSRDGEWARIPVIAISNPDADQLRRLHENGTPLAMHIRSTAGWHGEVTSGNVVMDIVGSELPDEIVLIGGHLDSWDIGTGAIDDGAGIAISVAAAELIARLPERPRRTIRVVMFGAEEVGLLGARAYAEQHADELPNHVLATESDFGAGRIWQFVSNVDAAANPAIDAIGRVMAPLGILRGGNEDGESGPDIIPMAMNGVPTVGLSQDGMDYFNLHHTPDDTLDKIDPDALAQNVAAYVALVYLAANMDVDFRTPAEASDVEENAAEQ
ncbi:M20/M25/M40 family metallo-hydrolase [uncultured Maricaulis sp.]|uniref:M20/M25/M40 family metallo-hydrolase n=1 Tax=uncultured Maricaulis sp. TaxID=174710 RepID=UPI0030DD4FFE|tara:strand:+ start:22497 stop:23939 length:1443 start_codon:yes stop_codon:yes gene_type:complete